MADFTFTNYSDVVEFARAFGNAALDYAIENSRVNPDQVRMINGARNGAMCNNIILNNFGDGDVEWSTEVVFERENINGIYHSNALESQYRLWRNGQCQVKTVRQAMNDGSMTKEELSKVIHLINKRNEALTIFNS